MTTNKNLTDLRAGDVVCFLGTPHRIDRIEPPTEAGSRLGCYGYARSNDGWGIAIYSGTWIEVL